MIYQACKYREKRTFPGRNNPGPGSGIVTLDALSTEGYHPAYDLVLPLIPETPTPPWLLHKFRAAAAIGFTAGEVIQAPAGNGIQELTFTQAPAPGFIRGELITEVVSGTTAVVARRYSDGRYQVIGVSAAWLGGANNVTGAAGGGGVIAGRIDAAATEDFHARFDSLHAKDNTVHLFYETNMCIPPGGALIGLTSGATGTVTVSEPPRVTFDLEFYRTQVANMAMAAATDVQFRLVGLSGDIAQLLNPLAADTQTMDRVARGELWWYADYIVEAGIDIMNNQFVLERTLIANEWGESVAYAQNGPRFQDGLMFRLHQIGGTGNAVGEESTRSLFYYEVWDYQKRINH